MKRSTSSSKAGQSGWRGRRYRGGRGNRTWHGHSNCRQHRQRPTSAKPNTVRTSSCTRQRSSFRNGSSIGGCVVDSGKFDFLNEKFPSPSQPAAEYHGLTFAETEYDPPTRCSHAVVSARSRRKAPPINAWITCLVSRPLALRMERHCENASKVARHLESHQAVDWVSYAGLNPASTLISASDMGRAGRAASSPGLKGGYDAGVASTVASC